jgi:hypothetical protein
MRTGAASDMTGGQSPLRRYAFPVGTLLLGVSFLVASTIGDGLEQGLGIFVVFVGAAAGMLYRARLDRLRGHAYPWRDERLAMVNRRAMAIGALVALAVVWGAWMVELAKGNNGMPYSLIVVVGFVAQAIALLVLSRRS